MIRTVVLGGPGTGKTHRLREILRQELKTVPAERIGYVSYTRQGTYQGVTIAKEEFDFSEAQCAYMRTLHSICFRITETNKADMLSAQDFKYFADRVGVNDIEAILKFYDMQRNNAHVAALLYDDLHFDSYTVQYVITNYIAYKKYAKKKDFTDLLESIVNDSITLPVDVAIIDEAQDLTTLQWKVVHTLFKDAVRMYIAGDPNQSIYDWAGADYKYFMHMSADSVEILDTTHRLPRAIWELGKRVHAMIDESTPYPTKCKDEEGVLRQIPDISNLMIEGDQTYLFLARANCYLEDIEDQLKEQGRLYLDSEGRPSTNKKKLLFTKAYFTYMENNGRVMQETKSLLMQALKGVDLSMLLKESTYEEVFMTQLDWDDKQYYFNIGLYKHYNDNPHKIRVASMHKVKGAEADNVYVLLDATKKTMLRMQDDPDAELRVLYVALTRAIHSLYIVSSRSKYSYPIIEIGQGVV